MEKKQCIFLPSDCKYKQPNLIGKAFLKLFSLCEEKISRSEILNLLKCPPVKACTLFGETPFFWLASSLQTPHQHPSKINLKYMLLMQNNVAIFGVGILKEKTNAPAKVEICTPMVHTYRYYTQC